MSIESALGHGQGARRGRLPGMSSAVRPMAVAPDERFVYLQVSFFHGLRRVRHPGARRRPHRPTPASPRSAPSAASSPCPTGPTACRASSTSSTPRTTAWRSTRPGRRCAPPGRWTTTPRSSTGRPAATRIVDVGEKPYWATNGALGDECWVSVSGEDKVVVIDYATAQPIATVPVGDHPQRVRAGVVARDVLTTWSSPMMISLPDQQGLPSWLTPREDPEPVREDGVAFAVHAASEAPPVLLGGRRGTGAGRHRGMPAVHRCAPPLRWTPEVLAGRRHGRPNAECTGSSYASLLPQRLAGRGGERCLPVHLRCCPSNSSATRFS